MLERKSLPPSMSASSSRAGEVIVHLMCAAAVDAHRVAACAERRTLTIRPGSHRAIVGVARCDGDQRRTRICTLQSGESRRGRRTVQPLAGRRSGPEADARHRSASHHPGD